MLKILIAAGALVSALVPFAAQATLVYGSTGLSGTFTTENFESNAGDGSAAGTQFSGMTWGSGNYVATSGYGYPNMSGSVITNFYPCCADPTSFTFAGALSELAFAFVSNPQSTTFSVYLNGVLQETDTFNTGYSGNFVKITDLVFDEIRITSTGSNDAYVIDTMQSKVANVPEPGSLALVGLALAGAARLRRRA